MVDIDDSVRAWSMFFETAKKWEDLVVGVTPEASGCGLIYDLPNLLNRPNESVAIADMRQLKVAEPHYHAEGATEIYIVLQGSGLVVVGGQEQTVSKGSVVVTPPNTAHFTIPGDDLVVAVINTPPFKPENYLVITETYTAVSFDQAQFNRLLPQ